MKINVEFDLTPAEFRESLGLPDVEAFQRDMMNRIQQQMEAGVDGYDPWSLMQPFLQTGLSQNLNQGLNQGMANFGNYQQMMLDMFRQAGSNVTASSSSATQEKQEASEKKANAKSDNTSSTRSSAASSSRSKSRKTQN
ncbi:hypothetical protein ACPF7Z_09900 [Halomonas sp. GXIMD04776]|uniref:hypothetical protein n=1 Tax=Halomonas sp. GXIMD04776 TaxID=3415605 RepID=UPI003CB5EE55